MDFKETEYDSVDWIRLAQETKQQRVLVTR
jgi:hypothetical protein